MRSFHGDALSFGSGGVEKIGAHDLFLFLIPTRREEVEETAALSGRCSEYYHQDKT